MIDNKNELICWKLIIVIVISIIMYGSILSLIFVSVNFLCVFVVNSLPYA